MTELDFTIINWSAFAPGLENKTDWENWAKGQKSPAADFSLTPNIDFIAPMHRRRLSQLTRMSLKTAFESCQDLRGNVESIFASRYGELGQTIKLLKAIAEQEDLSPAGFSLSVHNTAAGVNSVTSNNIKPYTTVSAGSATFTMALIEALGRLQNQEQILLVIGDEYAEEMHEHFYKNFLPFSLALLLGKSSEKTIRARLDKPNISNSNEALDFLKWLIGDEKNPFSTNLLSLEKLSNQ